MRDLLLWVLGFGFLWIGGAIVLCAVHVCVELEAIAKAIRESRASVQIFCDDDADDEEAEAWKRG